MERKKKHKVKKERPEKCKLKSSSYKDRDLSLYVHDRVELLQQAFSVLKPRDIIAMAPASIRHLDLDNIKEHCLEELLGISTKRLNSVLDGTEPPSDTDSSDSSGRMPHDAISLDSISSDEGNLSPMTSSSKSKKKRCKSKVKSKKDKKKDKSSSKVLDEAAGSQTKSLARSQTESPVESVGLTVLELLELQARARAIKAQLLAEQKRKGEAVATTSEAGIAVSSDDDVLIKEELPVVVELGSSDDEPPHKSPRKAPKEPVIKADIQQVCEDGKKIVNKRNDLTIIVPKPQLKRQIKLKRNNVIGKTVPQNKKQVSSETSEAKDTDMAQSESTTPGQQNTIDASNKETAIASSTVKRKKKKKSKKKKEAEIEAEASDQDEITLQLSDSEKMDLLEDFDRKSYDEVSSSSSEETDGSHSDSSRLCIDAAEPVAGTSSSNEDLVPSSKNQENRVEADVEESHEITDSVNEDLLQDNDSNQSSNKRSDKTLICQNYQSHGNASTTQKEPILPEKNLVLDSQNVGPQPLVLSTEHRSDSLQKLDDQSLTDKIESSSKPEQSPHVVNASNDEKNTKLQLLEGTKCQDEIIEVTHETKNNDLDIHVPHDENDKAKEIIAEDNASPDVTSESIAKDENICDSKVLSESTSSVLDVRVDGDKSSDILDFQQDVTDILDIQQDVTDILEIQQDVTAEEQSMTKDVTNKQESDKRSHIKKKKKKDKKAKKGKNKP